MVTVDTVQSMPDWEHAVQARINGIPALSVLEQERLRAYLAALEEARKMGTIDETEFETVCVCVCVWLGGRGLARRAAWRRLQAAAQAYAAKQPLCPAVPRLALTAMLVMTACRLICCLQAYDVHWLAGLQAGGEGVQALGGNWDSSQELRQDDDSFGPNDPQVRCCVGAGRQACPLPAFSSLPWIPA